MRHILLLSLVTVAFALTCSEDKVQDGLPENDLWSLRQRACGNGECVGNCTLWGSERTIDGDVYKARAVIHGDLKTCWDAMGDVITKCYRSQSMSGGGWSASEESYTLAFVKIGGGASSGKAGNWSFCTDSSQCANGCCSKEYSDDDKLKCTPNGKKCVKNGGDDTHPTPEPSRPTPTHSTPAPTRPTPTRSNPTPAPTRPTPTNSPSPSPLPKGVTAFHGEQSGIGSWFRASASGDSTNGHSWCGYPYNDNSPVFAPDIQQMTNGSNPVWPNPLWKVYTKTYCGLEAKVWNPANGKSMILYIGDAFDHRWVKTPGSIDVMKTVWSQLSGKPAGNKNDVILPIKWQLTGNRSAKYSAGGSGN